MVTFTINIPQMLAYIPYMDPMGFRSISPRNFSMQLRKSTLVHPFCWRKLRGAKRITALAKPWPGASATWKIYACQLGIILPSNWQHPRRYYHKLSKVDKANWALTILQDIQLLFLFFPPRRWFLGNSVPIRCSQHSTYQVGQPSGYLLPTMGWSTHVYSGQLISWTITMKIPNF